MHMPELQLPGGGETNDLSKAGTTVVSRGEAIEDPILTIKGLSKVDTFVERHRVQVERATKFSQMDEREA